MGRNIEKFIFEVPNKTKFVYAKLWKQNCKEPNFITVFKVMRDEFFPMWGINFNACTEEEKQKIKSISKKAYDDYKHDVYFVDEEKLARILSSIPEITSTIYYNYCEKHGKKPRFDSLFKIIKEDYLSRISVDFSLLDEGQRYEIEEMARDAFEGIKEGE